MRMRKSLIGSWVALMLATALAPSAIKAQQVRATNDGIEVRLDPDPLSPVIATLQAGVVLEWIEESGAYYAVSIPGEPGEEDRVGWVLSSEVELIVDAAADPVTLVIPGATPSGAVSGIPTLQEQYNRAAARSAGGRKKAIQGVGLAAASVTLFALLVNVDVGEPASYASRSAYEYALDRESSAGSVRDVAIIGGAAIAAYGVAQHFLGRREMGELELELPQEAAPSMQAQYEQANQRRSSGRKRVFWGGGLALASNVAVALYPVPIAEDYDGPEEFQNAVGRRDSVKTGRNWVTALAVVLGAWGAVDWVFGARDIARIEETARTATIPVPSGSHGGTVAPRLFVGLSDVGPAVGLNWVW